MNFIDINTFYGPKAGGIRTYHQAKIEWFNHQREHHYCLIFPGPKFCVEQLSPAVTLVQVFGRAMTADPQGYRLLLDYYRVWRWLRVFRPQVLEAGDPWLTASFCLALRAWGLWRGLLVAFYHSDPIPSYVEPWARRGGARWLRRLAARLAGRWFDRRQRRFDWTAVASRNLEEGLHRRGVTRVLRLPFGVDPAFFHAAAASPMPLRRHGASAPLRLLYAGRLDRDKGVELLLEILPALLADTAVTVTVAGRGAFTDRLAAFRHERYRFAGFLADAAAVAALYAGHDVLLAPGPHETFGLAVLEAMAAGLVVVGPEAGGTGELLREAEMPFRFAVGDAAGFLAAVHAAAAADLAPIAARSRATAAHYGTWDEAVARMAAAWTERAP